MSDFIPLSVPCMKGNELSYVKECIDTEWVSSAGKYVNKFEDDISVYTGAKRAVACVNGTAALHISLLVAGVKPDDEVIVPTITFMAPINTVKYCGANPVFMDSDEYYNINISKTIDFLKNETIYKDGFTFNKTTKKRISAIIPVHIFGNAVDIETLLPICRDMNIKIVEDATESLGTFYNRDNLKGRHPGTIGDIGCLSFNGNKIITTGGGGMILTNNDELAERAKYLTTQAKDDEVRYVHGEVGYNYRLTNIQAALGVAQLEQLPKYREIKKENYNLYKKEIEKIDGLRLAEVPIYADNNYWMYALLIDEKIYNQNREQVMEKLLKNNIQSRPVWHLNHLQKPYKDCQNYKIETALSLWGNTLNIPCSVGLTEEEINKVISVLKNA